MYTPYLQFTRYLNGNSKVSDFVSVDRCAADDDDPVAGYATQMTMMMMTVKCKESIKVVDL